MCNNTNNANSISEILGVILLLQKNADCGESCLDTCDRAFLSCGVSSLNCNTRPVMLYTTAANGTALAMPISKAYNETSLSSVFRVEKVDENTATFRVLNSNPDTTDTQQPFVATNSFFTVNLGCLCCLRCLQDTYVETV